MSVRVAPGAPLALEFIEDGKNDRMVSHTAYIRLDKGQGDPHWIAIKRCRHLCNWTTPELCCLCTIRNSLWCKICRPRRSSG